MPSIEEPSSPSNGFASADSALAYYKTQYEQLESELADFQASSRELETELEKDIEASERRERQLKEKAESLGYEVEEWKVCPGLKKNVAQWLTAKDQIQAGKGGGEYGTEQFAERNHRSSRHESHHPLETARY